MLSCSYYLSTTNNHIGRSILLKIVLMGDLHYPSIDETIPGLLEARDAFYEQLIGHFLNIDADFYVSIGDLTNFGHASELQEVYALLSRDNKTFYHTLGNHDLYSMTRQEVLELTGQSRYHSLTTDQAVFVFLDTAKELDFEDWGGWVDEEQLHWFENIVKAAGTKPLLVFGHHPVYHTTKRSENDKGSIHPSIDMWEILEQKDGVGLYFNGHTHIDSIEQIENWTFVQTSACLDQQAFRQIEITEDEIVITAIDIADEALSNHAATIYNHINHYKHQPDARGDAEDRACTVSLLPAEALS